MATSFTPTYDAARVDQAVAHLRRVVADTARAWTDDVQRELRSAAPWSDRNGPSETGKNARDSLEAEVAVLPSGDLTIIARSTRARPEAWKDYAHAPVGAFLELGTRYMAKREVIWPTVQAMAPDLQSRLEEALAGDDLP